MNYKHKKKYKQGPYIPKNGKKYNGENTPFYRSSFELKFFRWCDHNPFVKQWNNECFIIPYISPLDNKMHKYYVDGYILFEDKQGKLVKFLVEIKPSSQTKPPTPSKRKKKSTIIYEQSEWLRNQAKWKYADEWCKRNGFKFVVLTEKELNI
jgi:hypothetical protein